MLRFSSVWTSLLTLGCTSDLKDMERNRVMIVNGLTLLMIGVVCFFLVIYLLVGINIWMNWTPAFPLYACVLYLNRRGRVATARVVFYWGSLLIMTAWSFTNRRNGAEYAILTLGYSSALFFERKVSTYISFGIAFACFGAYKVYDITQPFKENPTFNYTLIPLLIMIVTGALVSFELLLFRSMVYRFSDRVQLRNVRLRKILLGKKMAEDQLRISNEEFRTSNESLSALTAHLDQIVKRKSAELKSYLEAINVHIYSMMTDKDGIILNVNDPLSQLTEYSSEELIGKHFSVLNFGDYKDDFYSYLFHAVKGGKPWRGELQQRTKYGSFIWIDAVIMPIMDQSDNVSHLLTLALPATDRKSMEEERDRYSRTLEAIAYRTSHNIRGPLARILGLMYLLEKDMITKDEVKKAVGYLIVSANELDSATRLLASFIYDHDSMQR